jgi:hypothetical protein
VNLHKKQNLKYKKKLINFRYTLNVLKRKLAFKNIHFIHEILIRFSGIVRTPMAKDEQNFIITDDFWNSVQRSLRFSHSKSLTKAWNVLRYWNLIDARVKVWIRDCSYCSIFLSLMEYPWPNDEFCCFNEILNFAARKISEKWFKTLNLSSLFNW